MVLNLYFLGNKAYQRYGLIEKKMLFYFIYSMLMYMQ